MLNRVTEMEIAHKLKVAKLVVRDCMHHTLQLMAVRNVTNIRQFILDCTHGLGALTLRMCPAILNTLHERNMLTALIKTSRSVFMNLPISNLQILFMSLICFNNFKFVVIRYFLWSL